jgi:hypothetical protein
MYWIEYTTTVAIYQTRAVCCAHCGEKFLYDLKARGTAKENATGGQNRELAQGLSAARAREEANTLLNGAIDPVPCPSCGCYQPDMVLHLKKKYCRWLGALGGVLLLTGPGVGGLALLAQSHQAEIAAGAGAGGTLGALLLVCRWLLVRRYDPNAGDKELRKQQGQARAYRPEDSPFVQQQRQESSDGKQALLGSRYVHNAAVLLVFAMIAGVIAVCMGVNAAQALMHARESVNWPSVKGEAVRSDYSQYNKRTRKTTNVIGDVSFTYVVNGKKYHAKNIYFGAYPDEAMRRKYENGTLVEVYYRPSDPSLAVLHPGLSPHSYSGVMGSGLVLLVALGLAAGAASQYRKYTLLNRVDMNLDYHLWNRPKGALRI